MEAKRIKYTNKHINIGKMQDLTLLKKGKQAKVRLFFVILLAFAMLIAFTFSVQVNSVANSNQTVNSTTNSSTSILLNRTSSTELYKNADGTQTLVIYGKDIFIDDKTQSKPHYVLPNASFFPIVSSNYQSLYSYQLNNTYTNYSAYFRNNSNTAGAVRFEKDGYFFTYDLSGGQLLWKSQPGLPAASSTLGSGVSSNSQDTQIVTTNDIAIYPNAYSNTNVTYELSKDMLKETFILSSLPSIKPYDYLEYSGNVKFNSTLKICANNQCYTPSGTQDNFNTSGQIDFKDSNNITRFYLKAPIITDSAGNSTTGIYVVHGSNAQMGFDLRIPTSFIQSAVFPIFIDPTVSTNTANSDDLKDAYISATSPTTNFGSDTGLYLSKSRGWYIQLNLSKLYQPNLIANITEVHFKTSLLSSSGLLPTSNLYYLFNDWTNGTGGGNILTESQITWNNQPCGTGFTNSTYCNLTAIATSTTTGALDYNVTNIIASYFSSNKQNISLFARNLSTALADSNFNLQNSRDSGGTAPYLQITFNPYILVVSPSATTYTTDANSLDFNVSTGVAMDECRWSPDFGVTNFTLTKLNSTYFYQTNSSVNDGYSNATFYCNQSSDGTWRFSLTNLFNMDSLNITHPRYLSVDNRIYQLKNNITSNSLSSADGQNIVINYATTSEVGFNGLGYSYNITNGTGITVDSLGVDSFINITNMTLILNSSSFVMGGAASKIIFNGTTIIGGKTLSGRSSTGAFGVTAPSNGFNVYDSLFNGVNVTDYTSTVFTTTTYMNSFLYNVTYTGGTIETISYNASNGKTGNLSRYWYLDSNVKGVGGTALQNANITIYNVTGQVVFSGLTDINGNIAEQTLLEYKHNGTGYYYSSPYTINISKTGYATNSTTYNFTAIGASVIHNVTLQDVTPPTVAIQQPLAQIYATNLSLPLNHTESDTIAVANCWYNVQNSTGQFVIANTTISSCLNTTFNLPGVDDDYVLTLFVNDTSNNIASANISFGVRISIPAVVLNYPVDGAYLNISQNVNINFTATYKTGLDTCEFYINQSSVGVYQKNYTWITPPNATQNFTEINLTDDNYKWYVRCNNSLGNFGYPLTNNSFTIDTIAPFVNITSIITTVGSLSTFFTANSTDTNLNNSCQYQVLYSNGSVAIATTSYTCNALTQVDVPSYGNYNLTVTTWDLAFNSNTTSQNFAVNPSVLAAGGGSLQTQPKIPVIGLKVDNLSQDYNNLQSEAIFAAINNQCLIKLKGGTLAVADYSDVCDLQPSDFDPVLQRLSNLRIYVPLADLYKFYNGYKKSTLFQGYETQGTIDTYNLFTSVLGVVNNLALSPPIVDEPKLIIANAQNITIVKKIISNKPLRSCEVTQGNESITCSVSNATLTITYFSNDVNFLDRIFQGVVAVTTDAPVDKVEQKPISITYRIYNLSREYFGVPLVWLLAIASFIVLIGLFILYKRSKVNKVRFEDAFRLK